MRGAWIWAGGVAVIVAGLVLASIFAEPLATNAGAGGVATAPKPVSDLAAPTQAPELTHPPAPAAPSPPARPVAFKVEEAPVPKSGEPSPLAEPPQARPKIRMPANNDTANNAPEDPSHNVGVSHAGPEPLLSDPCVIPLYYRGIERRKNLQSEDLNRIFVRVTVEGYTNTWHFRPEAQDEIYVDAWKKFDVKRAVKGEDGLPHVQIASLSLGGAEVKDLDIVLGQKPMGGGVFGRGLMEKMRLTVNWEKGLAKAEGCGPQ